MDRRKFSNRLRDLIVEKNISQSAAAIEMGLEQGSLSHYVNGKVEPRATALCVMADYFEVSTDYLLGRSDRR